MADADAISWSEAINKAALENIRSGKFDIDNDIEPNLFNATWQVLNGAVDAAFGNVTPNDYDFEFVNELKYNQGVFAAFKTHRQQNELAALLVDTDGNPRSYAEFEKACRPTLDGYNRNWLQTEYNTSVTRATFASNVKKFERDRHIYPNMRWTPSRSAETRPEHEKYYGLVLPQNHPFWGEHHPGDEYNCKCGIEQTDDAPWANIPKSNTSKIAGLDASPLNGAIFTDTHPFFKAADKATNKAVQGFITDRVNRFETVKEFKNGGKLMQSSLFDSSAHDARDIMGIGRAFASKGNLVNINPTKLHYKDSQYNAVFGGLNNTPYYRKCPDLTVAGNYYEFESFTGKFDKAKIKHMLKHGAAQSDKLIINNRGGSTDEFILSRINNQISNGAIINEVWLWDGKLLRQLL